MQCKRCVQQNLRRLQHDEIMATAMSVNVGGKACAFNITHLTALEQTVLSTSVPGCNANVVCDELLKHGTVDFCEADIVIFKPLHTPNDPSFSAQWGLSIIEAQKAWDYTRGTNNPITVSIMDSGINLNHPDLIPNLWVNPGEIPGNGIDDDLN